jgi:curli biogenesis system outer membrane secretion channel CsgG
LEKYGGSEMKTNYTLAIAPFLFVFTLASFFQQAFGEEAKEVTDGRARLVILPVSIGAIGSENRTGGEITIRGDVNADVVFVPEREMKVQNFSLTNALIRAFVSSNKFMVLDRTQIERIVEEIEFGTGEYGDVEKAVKAGSILNADYVLVSAIQAVYIKDGVEEVPFTDIQKQQKTGRVDLEYRLIDVATSQIVCSNQLKVETEFEVDNEEEFVAAQDLEFQRKLYDTTARAVLNDAIEVVFPICIVAIQGGEVYLNRGDGTVDVGDKFEVIRTGAAVVDPATGENLGSTEETVGHLTVTEVLPKMSKAIVDDSTIELQQGDRCRETQASIDRRESVSGRRNLNW